MSEYLDQGEQSKKLHIPMRSMQAGWKKTRRNVVGLNTTQTCHTIPTSYARNGSHGTFVCTAKQLEHSKGSLKWEEYHAFTDPRPALHST